MSMISLDRNIGVHCIAGGVRHVIVSSDILGEK